VDSPSTEPLIACPFCQGTHTRDQWIALDQEGDRNTVRLCQECGTHFLYPQPDSERLARAYASHYYGGEDNAKFNPRIEKLREQFARNRARSLTKGLHPSARILDVGCGDGRLLRTMGAIGDFELHGIELPGKAAERAAGCGKITLHLGTLDSCTLPESSFDLITLVHVFEHLPDPASALAKLNRLLRPGGYLFLSFPNCESWQADWFKGQWFHLDPPRHLTLVAPQTLIKRLDAMGIKCIKSSHISWEQNIYGWVQSVLNTLHPKRNLLYEWMKRNHSYTQGADLALISHFFIASALIPLILPLDVLTAILRRGATVELLFKKNPVP
jgi:2-polyprenyl-3-methyl-5-hydroxy-6-metoxy-1,4-benzoquinol methylase